VETYRRVFKQSSGTTSTLFVYAFFFNHFVRTMELLSRLAGGKS